MKIRKATLEDAEKVQGFNQNLFNDNVKYDSTLDMTWPKNNMKYYKKEIKNKDAIVLIAEEDKLPIGYLIGSMSKVEEFRNIKKMAEADNMFILEKFRGKGIGSALLQEFIKWAKSKGAEVVRIIVYSENTKAISVYSKIGFVDYCKTMEMKI